MSRGSRNSSPTGSRRGKLTVHGAICVGASASADMVIVAVGTHDGNGGWQTDTVRAALAEHRARRWPDGATLVVRSTLPPDFIRQLPTLVASRRAAVGSPSIPVMLNPEFTREGRAVRDYQQPDRIVLGIVCDPDGHGEAALRELYRDAGAPIVVMGAIDAAITKLGANLFLATKISFANELAEICDAFGADVATVVDGMSYDSRIGGAFLQGRRRVRRVVPAQPGLHDHPHGRPGRCRHAAPDRGRRGQPPPPQPGRRAGRRRSSTGTRPRTDASRSSA